MARRDRLDSRQRDRYFYATRRPVNSLIFLIPLLAFFHTGAVLYGSDLWGPLLVSRFLEFFGATAAFLPALAIIVVLFLQQAVRRDGWKIQPLALAGMAAESVVYTLPLIALSFLAGPTTTAGAAGQQGLWEAILQAVGAGIYEEFLFRLLLVGLSLLLLVDILELNEKAAALCVIVFGGLLFSLAHFDFVGVGRPFAWSPFVFLAVAGMFWGLLYAKRGFGIAVGSHILWDIYVVVAGT